MPSQFTIAHNAASQRTNVALGDNSHWVYTFDELGQVLSGKRYWSDGTPVVGQQFEYVFDHIGNRQSAGAGGDPAKGGLHYQSYSPDSLNQYTSRTVPGFLQVVGSANANATVSLWGPGGSYAMASRKGDYFAGEIPVNNSSNAVFATITNLAVLSGVTPNCYGFNSHRTFSGIGVIAF